MAEQKTLVKKLSEVMKQVKYIEKKGFNKFHQYKYATESDVAEKVREVLAEQNVMMIPNLVSHTMREHINAKGKTEYIVAVNMEFKFYDGDSGEEITFRMSGEGQDAGDKGIYKAITGAQKYALMKVFMIPTGDDPEADNSVDERNASENTNNKPAKAQVATEKQLNLINKLLDDVAAFMNITKDEAYKTLKKHLKKDLEWFTPADASKAIEILNGALKQGA
ncbi:MAG TPA: ERF family protein [Emticicia sp.]